MSALTSLQQSNITPVAFPARFRLHAYSAPVKINLDSFKNIFIAGKYERYSRDCAVIERDDNERVFIFRFGTAVFFNVPASEHEYYLSKLGISLPATQTRDQITEDDFVLRVDPQNALKVEFNGVSVPDLDLSKLQLVAQLLAQSSALEVIEKEVERFLGESEQMTQFFSGRALKISRREKLLKFLGSGLSARHTVITQLSLLKEPDKTWEREDLYKLYKDLFEHFDILDRIEKLEQQFQLSSQVTELLIEMVNARRAEILEIVVIVLICVEVIKGFLG
jgi:uncharacterized Rmd1/YagE family protein